MNNEITGTITNLGGSDVAHCTAPWYPAPQFVSIGLETLPYDLLGGARFERLCYEILLSKGLEPRFFGRSGQAQYGVDLVIDTPGRFEVYQCKNLSSLLSERELKDILETFESGWLGSKELPHPNHFTICCPSILRDSDLDGKWLHLKQAFEQRTHVELHLWHRDLLDDWLKKLPDIVADLFSDRHAEAFCDIEDWAPDLFVRICEDKKHADPRLSRFFAAFRTGHLYIDEEREQEISEALARSPVVLLRGMPGAGKTFTAFALAGRSSLVSRRAYFVDVAGEEVTRTVLRDGIRRRLSRPSLFILENCQNRVETLTLLLAELESSLGHSSSRIACLARRVPSALRSREDENDLAPIAERAVTIDLEVDDDLLDRMIFHWRPDFIGLSKGRKSKVVALSGRDLFILDELLSRLASPSEIDELSPSRMYDTVRAAYFANRTADDLPMTRRLAALAQFELRPRADVLAMPEDERRLLGSLCVRAGTPPRWHFLHSSAAELVLHALWSGMGAVEPAEIASYVAKDIIEYFRDLTDAHFRPPATPSYLQIELTTFLASELRLVDAERLRRIKATVLDSEAVRRVVAAMAHSAIDPRLAYLCAKAAFTGGAASAPEYARWLLGTIEKLLNGNGPTEGRDLSHLDLMLRVLEDGAPELSADLMERLEPKSVLRIFEASGTVCELTQVVAQVPERFGRAIVDCIDDAYIDRLIARTVLVRRSLGLLHMGMRRLHSDPRKSIIGHSLEQKLGVGRMLDLIAANGTIYELFTLLHDASPSFSQALVRELNDSNVQRIIAKTVASGRSVGTLHMTFRDLRRNKNTKSIEEELERKIGPIQLLTVIAANGSICELVKIVGACSSFMAAGLVGALDDALVDKLVTKAIALRRSIAYLPVILRSMRAHASSAAIGRALESRIGAARLLDMVGTIGSLYEFVMFIRDSSREFARELLDHMNENRMRRIVDTTIASARSIGMVSVALRELRSDGATIDLGSELERTIGVVNVWRVIAENSSVGPMIDLIQDASPGFRSELLMAAQELTTLQWARVLARGDFFQLCELVARGDSLVDDDSGPSKLFTALVEQMPLLLANATWYERNTGFKILRESQDCRARTLVVQALMNQLGSADLELRASLTPREVINAIDLLFEVRPADRLVLGNALAEMLRAEPRWKLDPKGDMALLRAVLRLLSARELMADDTALSLMNELAGHLTPPFIAQCRTVDLLWTLWAMFAFFRKRLAGEPRAIAMMVPGTVIESIQSVLRTRTADAPVEEWRARCGLLGLLDLLGFESDRAVLKAIRVELLRHDDAGVWWLVANQKFVAAWLVLRGVSKCRSSGEREEAEYQARLLSAAQDYPEIDAAVSVLYDDVIRRRQSRSVVRTASTLELVGSAVANGDVELVAGLSLREIVSSLGRLHAGRAELRFDIAARTRALLPPTENWRLDATQDMWLPVALLEMLADGQFSEVDVEYFVHGLQGALTFDVIEKSRTFDVAWCLWAFFSCLRARDEGVTPNRVGGMLSRLMTSATEMLKSKVQNTKVGVAEWRGRFALAGVLALFGHVQPAAVTDVLRQQLNMHGDAGAWWLCVDQTFVNASLILRGVEASRTLPLRLGVQFRERLVSAAQGLNDLNAAGKLLVAITAEELNTLTRR